jgi:NADPH-dependent glutamate synthase beta subunit-like oxidoreductase
LKAERVTMVYRRTDREMTCYEHEYDFARKEGVEFRFLSQPWRVVLERGQPKGLECLRVELGALDASGRPAPLTIRGSEFVLEADQVVKAWDRTSQGSLSCSASKRRGGLSPWMKTLCPVSMASMRSAIAFALRVLRRR